MPKENNSAEWIEVSIIVNCALNGIVADFLVEMGSNGILEEPVLDNSSQVYLKAYFGKDFSRDVIIQHVNGFIKNLPPAGSGVDKDFAVHVNDVPDEDWNKLWRSFFEPIKVTDRVVIKPSWKDYHRAAGDIVIELDPGMAFGTGTHPSTRMCLEVIEDLTGSLSGCCSSCMLDVGTGSGILSITAARLGVKNITAIDIDLDAIECAGKNAVNNNVGEHISFSTTPLKEIPGEFPLVVANILPHVLIEMKDELTGKVCKDGFLILSGILKEKSGEVSDVFSRGLKPVRKIEEDEWACLIFRNTP